MSKLNLTQVNYVINLMENAAVQTISMIMTSAKEGLLPPKLTDKEVLKAVYKEISDAPSPKSIRWLLEGRPYPIEKARLSDRDAAYTQLAHLEAEMNLVAENFMLEAKGKLLFEDTWEPGEVPQYLVDDIVSELMEFVQYPESDEA